VFPEAESHSVSAQVMNRVFGDCPSQPSKALGELGQVLFAKIDDPHDQLTHYFFPQL